MTDVTKRSRLRTPTAFIAGIATVGLIGGIAYAAIPSTSTGRITACVDRTDGATRIIDTDKGQACVDTERAVTWAASLRHRGVWNSTASYRPQDIVTLDGSSYIARRASSDTTPFDHPKVWGLLALAGADGSDGQDGVDGGAGADAPTTAFSADATRASYGGCAQVDFARFKYGGEVHLSGTLTVNRLVGDSTIAYEISMYHGGQDTFAQGTITPGALQVTVPFDYEGPVSGGDMSVRSQLNLQSGSSDMSCGVEFSGSYKSLHDDLTS